MTVPADRRPSRTFLARIDLDSLVDAIADRLDRVFSDAGVPRTRAEALHDARNVATVVSCCEVPALSAEQRAQLFQMLAAARLESFHPVAETRSRAAARAAVLEDVVAILGLGGGR